MPKSEIRMTKPERRNPKNDETSVFGVRRQAERTPCLQPNQKPAFALRLPPHP